MAQGLYTVDKVLSSFDELDELTELDLLSIQYIQDNYSSTDIKTWKEWFEVLVESNRYATRIMVARQKESKNNE